MASEREKANANSKWRSAWRVVIVLVIAVVGLVILFFALLAIVVYQTHNGHDGVIEPGTLKETIERLDDK